MGDELDADGKPKIEVVEMWCRDPVELVQELLGNASFKKQAYKPYRVFKQAGFTNREYHEMCTANWWWEIQVRDADSERLSNLLTSITGASSARLDTCARNSGL